MLLAHCEHLILKEGTGDVTFLLHDGSNTQAHAVMGHAAVEASKDAGPAEQPFNGLKDRGVMRKSG